MYLSSVTQPAIRICTFTRSSKTLLKTREQSLHQLVAVKRAKQLLDRLNCTENGKFKAQHTFKRLVNTFANKKSIPKSLIYVSSLTLGASIGLFTGYLISSGGQLSLIDTKNAASASESEFLSRKFYNENSAFKNFPLKITLYQFERCPYCEQVRAYLDFFGFNYEVVDVDPISKREVKALTKQATVPMCVLEDEVNQKKWFLTNACTILSLLETLRNEDGKNFNLLVQSYLPVLLANNELRYANKYLVSENSDLNNMELRKWINNVVVPSFKWNSSHTWSNACETVEQFSLQNDWQARFNALKQIYLYYYSAYWLNKESDRFKRELAKTEPIIDGLPINALHRAIVKWERCIGSNGNFNGKRCPNLADLSFYGVVHAFEGTSYFNELLSKHKVFSNWYREMKALATSRNGYKQFRKLSNEFVPDWMLVESVRMDKNADEGEQVREQTVPTNENEEKASGDKTLADINKTANDNNETSGQSVNEKRDALLGIRILSLTYLAHVVIFSYAAIMRGRWD